MIPDKNTSRRDFIKVSGLAGLSFSLTSFNINHRPSLKEEILGHGSHQYKVNLSWGNLDPSKTPVKNCHEMVMDRKGRLFMITDEPKNNIIIYDQSGKLLGTWGTEYPGGHGLTLSEEGGEEFLFICDPGAGRVVKATLEGKKILELPSPTKTGIYPAEAPYRPTETAVAPNGDIYVADGYGSQFILQFDRKGDFIRKFGGAGSGDDQFSTAHGVCIDKRSGGEATLLCTSRGHNSFKRFTLDGKYISTIFLPGAFVCRPVIHGKNLYSGVCWSRLRYLEQTADSGFVTILNEQNRVISNPGGTAPEYRDGRLQLMLQSVPVFKHCHDVCVDQDENLYVCQWNASQTYPIKLERL